MEDSKEMNILLIDDHPMILEGYESVLSRLELDQISLNIDTAGTCDQAWDKINSSTYHIVFLDINFPVTEENKILSGEDLGIKIKQAHPKIKIVILTFIEDKFRLHNILINIDPSGFLLKEEASSENLKRCIETILTAPPYYGPKVLKLLRSKFTNKFSLDETDRIILYQLSLGTKTKELGKYVNLSLRAVEDRKKKLKKKMGISDRDTKALLEKARESGYI